MILTKDGDVFHWSNDFPIIESSDEKFILKPIKLNLPRIKLITCTDFRTFAISDNNTLFQIFGDQLIKFELVQYVLNIHVKFNDIYILNMNGELLYSEVPASPNDTELKFEKIECDKFIESLYYINSYTCPSPSIVISTGNCVYFLDENDSLNKTKYKTPFDYYACEFQLTYKTIDLKLQNEIQTKSLQIKGEHL